MTRMTRFSETRPYKLSTGKNVSCNRINVSCVFAAKTVKSGERPKYDTFRAKTCHAQKMEGHQSEKRVIRVISLTNKIKTVFEGKNKNQDHDTYDTFLQLSATRRITTQIRTKGLIIGNASYVSCPPRDSKVIHRQSVAI